MNKRILLMFLVILAVASMTVYGQMITRTDAIWARVTTEAITLDGKLNEASWATAESLTIKGGQDNGMPGSGWYREHGVLVDPADATVKFLVKDDSLFIAIIAKDKSIGGGGYNYFDGFLMNLHYREATGFQSAPTGYHSSDMSNEIFYGWCSESWADPSTAEVGALPGFFGPFGSYTTYPRPDSLKNIWDAATTVQGIANSDTTADTSYTMEIKINLKYFGYDVQQTGGDIVMWSMSLYDEDYYWPADTLKEGQTRTWIQGPWSGAATYNHERIFVSPEVTTTSGTVPTIGPDYTIPNGAAYGAPTLDGQLTESVWKYAPSIPLQYGNSTIRNAYANTAKYRSGQYQATVNGAQNDVLDPNYTQIKYFYIGDTLYLGFDVQDQYVQAINDYDRYDGIRVIMEERDARNGDSTLAKRTFSFRVDSAGAIKLFDDLAPTGWDSLHTAVNVALALKNGTTVDTVGATTDSGYTAEMKINLRAMGYAAGRGDGVVFLSVMQWDGDSFSGGSYGTRTWFMREGNGNDGAAWFYMDPSVVVSVSEKASGTLPGTFELLGNYPNPFNPTTNIKFRIGQTSQVTLDVYDITGRLVHSQSLGAVTAGDHSVPFNALNLATGSYFYRLKTNAGATLVGKMMLLK